MQIKLLNNRISVDKKYIKKLLLLMKCYLNLKGIFVYGYERVVEEFLKIYNNTSVTGISSTKSYYFDIMNVLIDFNSSKKEIINFSNIVLEYIIKEMERG